jgi:hypothetical protein
MDAKSIERDDWETEVAGDYLAFNRRAYDVAAKGYRDKNLLGWPAKYQMRKLLQSLWYLMPKSWN